MQATYQGSCHCGAVRFEADIDFEAGSNKCNCSLCSKTRNWNVIVRPDAFRLLTSENALADYQFGGKQGHHLFCRMCGVRTFGRGHVKEIGGDYVAIQVMAIDGLTDAERAAIPVRHGNGRDNDWMSPPAEIRHM